MTAVVVDFVERRRARTRAMVRRMEALGAILAMLDGVARADAGGPDLKAAVLRWRGEAEALLAAR